MGKDRSRQAIEFAKAHLVLTWWAIVLAAIAGAGLASLYVSLSTPPPTLERVIGDGPDLWARTQERVFLQGLDVVWHVSHDGGLTWLDASPPPHVEDADPVTEVCTQTACYRLVDGIRIERRTRGDEAWELLHEHDAEPFQPDSYRSDWEEEAAIAATDRPDRNEITVAAGRDGVLVLTESGTWSSVPVGTPIAVRFMRWLLAPLVAVVVVVGAAGHLVIRVRANRKPHTSPIAAADSR